MRLKEILEQYSDTALDKLSADKLEEAVNLRLPRSIVVQEIADALNTLTYVAKVLAPARPPTYTFLKTLLDAPGYSLPVEGFKENAMAETAEMANKTETGKGLSADKNYPLYLKILKTAWEDDVVDRSEAQMLETLARELGIWTREHLLLEHHPEIFQLSELADSFISTRNHLLLSGLVLMSGDNYIIAEEVALQIRRVWGIDLEYDSFSRLLNALSKQQLSLILEKTGLPVSGNKDELVQRVIDAFIPPGEALGFLHIDELRDLSRQTGAQVSGLKAEVVNNLIEYFDRGKDLEKEIKEEDAKIPVEPEDRELEHPALARLLQKFSNDQLYDILSSCQLKTSGTKEVKINRLLESPWSEYSLLDHLRRAELSDCCRKLGIQVSGVKSELIDRLVEWGAEVSFAREISESTVDTVNREENPLSAPGTGGLDNIGDPKAQPLKIPGLDDIKRDYPGLEPDEQAILALIKETKSLTEQDIERASRRHGFQWYLTKAHMAELAAKLKDTDHLPIRVKSVRNTNIYEWCGEPGNQARGKIDKIAARDAINALRQGVVPGKHLDLLMVGQENVRDHLLELLEDVSAGKSAFKFIRGPYGAGKTFLCSWLRQYALDREYVASVVNIGPDQPLSDLPVFFSGIVNGLRTTEKRDSCALADVLESWLLSVQRKTVQLEGLHTGPNNPRERLTQMVEAQIESELAAFSGSDPCFAPALRAFYRARTAGDYTTAANALAWISGSRAIASRALNEIGVKGFLEPNQVFSRMRTLLEMIGGSRFRGLLLVVDELELIRKFPHTRQREQALETLRLLIDETGQNGLPGCLLVFTGTDTFFDDDRAGLKSYEALDNRVTAPGGSNGMVSVKQPVTRLEGLGADGLNAVARKVRDMHGAAYDWDSGQHVPDEFLEKMTREMTVFGDEYLAKKPRPVLRELIHILDLCEENPGIIPDEIVGAPTGSLETAGELDNILFQ